jgi:hypothetical protein
LKGVKAVTAEGGVSFFVPPPSPAFEEKGGVGNDEDRCFGNELRGFAKGVRQRDRANCGLQLSRFAREAGKPFEVGG